MPRYTNYWILNRSWHRFYRRCKNFGSWLGIRAYARLYKRLRRWHQKGFVQHLMIFPYIWQGMRDVELRAWLLLLKKLFGLISNQRVDIDNGKRWWEPVHAFGIAWIIRLVSRWCSAFWDFLHCLVSTSIKNRICVICAVEVGLHYSICYGTVRQHAQCVINIPSHRDRSLLGYFCSNVQE